MESDDLAGATTATEYLLSLGHRRIGFLGGPPDLASASLRENGFRDAMASVGADVDESLIVVGGYRADSAEGPARALLDRDDRPIAVFAANDLTAIRTMGWPARWASTSRATCRSSASTTSPSRCSRRRR